MELHETMYRIVRSVMWYMLLAHMTLFFFLCYRFETVSFPEHQLVSAKIYLSHFFFFS